MDDSSTMLVGILFVIMAMILLVILIFLYRLTIAIGRLDSRLEQFARHLRDLNLYDLSPPEMEDLLSPETAIGASTPNATDQNSSRISSKSATASNLSFPKPEPPHPDDEER